MNKLDWFYAQVVQESEVDDAFAKVEQADRALMLDHDYVGVVYGLGVVQNNPVADLTVDIAAGVAYDQSGRRIAITAAVGLDVSVDSNGSSTAVVNPGNEKWVSVFVRFEVLASNLRTDGNGVPVYFNQDESFEFVVVQGSEAAAGLAVRPSLLTDGLLIADVLRDFGQTQILDADIESDDTVTDPNSRFEYVFNLTASSPAQVRTGRISAVGQELLDELNDHINNVANPHPASAIVYSGSGNNWADGTAVSAANVEAAIDEVVTDLGGVSGANKIGCAITTTWRDGTGIAGANVDAALEEIIADLADQVGATADGASRIGAEAVGNLAQGSVRSQLNELDTEKGGLTTTNAWTGANTWSSAIQTMDSQFDVNGAVTFAGVFNLNNATGDSTAGVQSRFFTENNQQAHAGGTEQIFSLHTPSASGEVGILEIHIIGSRDNDETLRRNFSAIVHYGRPTSGSTSVIFGVLHETDATAGGIGITGYQVTTSSNTIVINVTGSTGGTTNNYTIFWRRHLAPGDQ